MFAESSMSSPTTDATLVTVCLCTYKRAHLAATLQSLFAQTILEHATMDIVVVDNDGDRSAAPIVAAANLPEGCSLRYLVEPRRSISAARNASVVDARGTWLAFIDDDELAVPNWLAELVSAAEDFRADVVMGLVESRLPPDAPRWAASSLFDRSMPPRGSIVDVGRCGNALLRRSFRERLGTSFSDVFGQSGGEDFAFFRTLQQNGAVMVSCPEAVVTETVPHERLLLAFQFRRSLVTGEAFARVIDPAPSHLVRLSGGAMAVAKFVLFVAAAVASSMMPNSAGIRLALRAVEQAGKLRHFLGLAPLQRG